ncbi:MAG: AbrB/MazE/SpoVT family DNA-binding domain-containing protein [bacterium]|nr:AbrB/MazE/SpoVT family DNA-binding domain-containing protein [bacterium]
MLAKLTRGNQVTIPKPIVKKAGLKTGNDYLEVEYANGIIYLRPMDVEERIPPEVFEKFKEKALSEEKGDATLSVGEIEDFLARRAEKD